MRIVCISDTHTRHRMLELPEGDLLIHAGDFLGHRFPEELEAFNRWLAEQPHRHKIVVAGNHDRLLEWEPASAELITEAVYLRDSGVEIEGVRFWGSPWTPTFFNWAFMRDEAGLAERFAQIPADTQVLITHGPPRGIGDLCPAATGGGQEHAGSEALRDELANRLRPALHVFGHIHEGYGTQRVGQTLHVNAAQMTGAYDLANPPIVVELDAEGARAV